MSEKKSFGDDQQNGRQTVHPDALYDYAMNQDASSAAPAPNLFDPSYRGPQGGGYLVRTYPQNESGGFGGIGPWARRRSHGQLTGPPGQIFPPGLSHGLPSARGGFQGHGVTGGRAHPFPGSPESFTQFGTGYPPQAYGQPQVYPQPSHQHQVRGFGHSRPRYLRPSTRGRSAGQRQLPPRMNSPQSPQSQSHPAPPAPPGRFPSSSPAVPFNQTDFPSLGHKSHPPSRGQQSGLNRRGQRGQRANRAQGRQKSSVAGRGASGRRGKFVSYTDFDVGRTSSSANPANTAGNTQQQADDWLPPPRRRRNLAFCLDLDDCYRGKVVFIDELVGLDFSGHPAVIRSVDTVTRKLRFFKKSSFKNIGGFLYKYGEYTNKSQKKWHEKQWLLLDDGVTKPHHGTPVLSLADGEKMPEHGSYVDIHGDAELPIEYFSKYSRYGVFPEIYLPEDQMEVLEKYSTWYLEKDQAFKAAEEKKAR